MLTTLIDIETLHEHLSDPDWVIIDCRFDLFDTASGYRDYQAEHLPGAIYANLDKDLSGPPLTDCGRHPLPDAEKLTRTFSAFGIDHTTQVIAYDASFGAIAARLWWLLRYMEHDAVAVLDGGWQAWRGAGFETEQGENSRPSRQFSGNPRNDWLVTLEEVNRSVLLIDSREPQRFRGEQEPIDPVPGHIPGAVNYFWKSNIDEHGKFYPPRQVSRGLLEIYSDAPPGEVVFYCGSGVTACHNLLAAAHAGLPAAKLYAGSWSEWCRDPDRPVATGDSA